MPENLPDVTVLTIFITTILLLVLGSFIVYFLFLYQRKRYRHEQEKTQMKENFSNTLMQSKFEIQEQTLNHISKQIHDHFSPGLWSVKTLLRTTRPDEPLQVKEKLDEAVVQVQELYDQMRALSLSLNTDQLMRLGFKQSLQNELNRLAKTGDYHTSLSVKGHELYIEPDKTIILFRICQEALNNILKHADARHVDVVIDYAADPVTLIISDDGKGFNPEEVISDLRKQDSTGLRNIFMRAEQIGARAEVLSQPGAGTRIIIYILHLKDNHAPHTTED